MICLSYEEANEQSTIKKPTFKDGDFYGLVSIEA